MWKFSSKKDKKKEVALQTTSNNGARKVALFLSVLEPETAERLLSLFDPEIANAISEEAKTIDAVPPEDVEAIVSVFLNAVGRDSLGSELTDALVAEARHNVSARFNRAHSREARTRITPFEVVASGRLAGLLKDERPAILAIVASKLSESNDEEFSTQFSPEVRKLFRRIPVKSHSTPSLKRLEDVLFERSCND